MPSSRCFRQKRISSHWQDKVLAVSYIKNMQSLLFTINMVRSQGLKLLNLWGQSSEDGQFGSKPVRGSVK